MLETTQTYQDQRSIVKGIASVDINALGNFLLAYFQVTSPTGFAKLAIWRAEIQRVILLDSTLVDQFLLAMKTRLYLLL